jgi:hypothetical protein
VLHLLGVRGLLIALRRGGTGKDSRSERPQENAFHDDPSSAGLFYLAAGGLKVTGFNRSWLCVRG